MNAPRLSLLPAAAILPFVPDLKKHLSAVAADITPENLTSVLDGTMTRLITGAFQRAGAQEGAIWLHDTHRNSLVMAFNTGPNAAVLVGKFSQPLTSGIVSMVFASEQPFLENEVFRNSRHDKTFDTQMHLRTESMVATPFYFLGACRGIVSGVQLQPAGAHERARGFGEHDLVALREAATILGKLLDERILRIVVGLG